MTGVPKTKSGRVLNARPDPMDFRDKMFTPTLVEVPQEMRLQKFLDWNVPILDQGKEGACTGFGLATVCNYLLRTRKVKPDKTGVSPRMFYELAKRYDEWPGEDYEGSSARGAMKAWHKHGVCSEEKWPYQSKNPRHFDSERMSDAVKRPLGAYYRVNHKDLVAMHCAITEAGILYATAIVHEGWEKTLRNGVIPWSEMRLGGHAFAIVAYDGNGFWIQNSWGRKWGRKGLGLISYADWIANGTDVWVARLGVPIELPSSAVPSGTGGTIISGKAQSYDTYELRPHIVSIGNDGKLRNTGAFGTTADDVKQIFEKDFYETVKSWKKKRMLLYAHGGLVSEGSAIQRIGEYRKPLLDSEVYPLAFIWKTDYWTTLTNIVEDAFKRRRPEGFIDNAKDFMLDRLDDALEPLARQLTGKAQWDEMKENALLASKSRDGGARIVLENLSKLRDTIPDLEIHIVGHSAGSIFLAPQVLLSTTPKGKKIPKASSNDETYLDSNDTGYGLKIKTCTLWAPACTINLFNQTYLQGIQNNNLEAFTLFNLADAVEQDDDCANIYHKSLLYLVSNAFEEKPRIPFFREGVPILGMMKFVEKDPTLKNLFAGNGNKSQLVIAPNSEKSNPKNYSSAKSHGGFDDDMPTVTATLLRILGESPVKGGFLFSKTSSGRQLKRKMLNRF